MTDYLSYKFNDNKELVSTFDEAPLWSAAFGLFLLKHLELRKNITLVDIGSGAGFPLLELAERLGNSCKLYGIDPWANANERALQKIKNYGITNTEIIECSAEKIPLNDSSIDIITSNLGINNFTDLAEVLQECKRILKPKGRIAITSNINGHWKEFYSIFESTLHNYNKADILLTLKNQQEHRGNAESISKLFSTNNLKVVKIFREDFQMSFTDGSAFLNHHFVKLGWISSWIDLVNETERNEIFTALEKNLNTYAGEKGTLLLTVPMLYVEAEKI